MTKIKFFKRIKFFLKILLLVLTDIDANDFDKQIRRGNLILKLMMIFFNVFSSSSDVDSGNVLGVMGMQKFIILGFLIKIENKQIEHDRNNVGSHFSGKNLLQPLFSQFTGSL
jgi:hypothetical protein